MTTNIQIENKNEESKIAWIVIIYPVVLLIIGVLLNYFLLDINPYEIALPTASLVSAFVISAILLTINHTWIMTATELVRTRYKIHSTPEEWAASGDSEKSVSEEGVNELKRHHDTHLNTTENSIYFALLGLPFVIVTPSPMAGYVWLITYAIGRLGYTYGFLYGKDGVRGLFMSVSLLAMYGMGSYLVACLLM